MIKCGLELAEIANKVVKTAEDTVSRVKNAVEPYVRERFEKVKEVGYRIIDQAERKFQEKKLKIRS